MSTMHYKGCEATVEFAEDAEFFMAWEAFLRAVLHKAMSLAAKREGMSLNKWVTATLECAVK